MVSVDDKINNGINMFLGRWPFHWPWQSAGAIGSASPNAACPELLWKPLDAIIRQLLALYCPSSHQGNSKQNKDKKCPKKTGHFVGCGGVPVQYRMHHPIEKVYAFVRCH
jgi:hypothetical protein